VEGREEGYGIQCVNHLQFSRLPHKPRVVEHPKPFTRAVSATVALRGEWGGQTALISQHRVTVCYGRSKNEVVDRTRGHGNWTIQGSRLSQSLPLSHTSGSALVENP